VVKVMGNREWLFVKSTPSSEGAPGVGGWARRRMREQAVGNEENIRLCGAAVPGTGSRAENRMADFTCRISFCARRVMTVQAMVPGCVRPRKRSDSAGWFSRNHP